MWKAMVSPALVAVVASLPSQSVAAQPASVNPRANELFDREPVLKSWALRIYDINHDGWLTTFEAADAAASFRDIADADRDGQVSLSEYGTALDFIRARY